MTKRSAIVIAAGLVASLMAGMVGAMRQATAWHGQVIVRTLPASGASAPAPASFADDQAGGGD